MGNFSSHFDEAIRQFKVSLNRIKSEVDSANVSYVDRERVEESLCVESRRLFSIVARFADDPNAVAMANDCKKALEESSKITTIDIFRTAIDRRVGLLECFLNQGLEEFERKLRMEAHSATNEVSGG
jgi:hypothetical protein